MGHVGDLIEAYIDRIGYKVSSRAIAKKIGVTGGAVDKWRAGVSFPGPENMRELAALIGVSERTLIDAALLDAGYLSRADAADLDGFNDESQQEILDAIAEDDPPASPARRRRHG